MIAADEQVVTAARLAERFRAMVKCREVDNLGQWLADATASGARGLTSFANGIRQDITAVANALSLPWSNGPGEGLVNRPKFIKRMIYGLANVDLLRQRVLFPYAHRLA